MIARRGILAGLTLALAGCVAGPPVTKGNQDDGFRGTGLTNGFPMPTIELTDQTGKPFSLAKSIPTPVCAIFFGYTSCPDVCAGILADMAAARRRLEPALAKQVSLVMISTDPTRDTPEALTRYLTRIDETFIGLTGDLAKIVKIATGFGVPIEKGKQLPSGGYEVDHGVQILGVGKDRRVQVVWTQGTSIADLREDLTTLVKRSS